MPVHYTPPSKRVALDDAGNPIETVEATPPAPKGVDINAPSGGWVPDILQHGAAAITRGAGPIIGSVIGAGMGAAGGATGGPAAPATVPAGGVLGSRIGGAAGGAISELMAEAIEPGGIRGEGRMMAHPGRVAAKTGVAGAWGALPGSWLVRQGKILPSIASGAGAGYLSTAINKKIEGTPTGEAFDPTGIVSGGPHWSGMDLVLGPGLGGVASGGLSMLPSISKAVKAGQRATPPEAKPAYTGPVGLKVAFDKLHNTPLSDTTVTPDTIAAHAALAAEQAKNPTGSTANKIKAIADLEKLQAEANALVSKPATAAEKAQEAANKLLASEKVAAEKAFSAHVAETEAQVLAREKAQEQANKLVGSEKVAADKAFNAQEADKAAKALAQEKAQEAANKLVSGEKVSAEKAFKTQAAEADAAEKLAKLKGTLTEEHDPTSITETISGPGEHGGKERATFRRTAPEPEPGTEGAEGSTGDPKPATILSGAPTKVLTPEVLAVTRFPSRIAALEHAAAAGVKTTNIEGVGKGNWRVHFEGAPTLEKPAGSGINLNEPAATPVAASPAASAAPVESVPVVAEGKPPVVETKAPEAVQTPPVAEAPVVTTPPPPPVISPKRQAQIDFAKKNFSPEANQKLETLATQYDAATDPVQKRGIGAQMAEVDKIERRRLAEELAAKAKANPPAAKATKIAEANAGADELDAIQTAMNDNVEPPTRGNGVIPVAAKPEAPVTGKKAKAPSKSAIPVKPTGKARSLKDTADGINETAWDQAMQEGTEPVVTPKSVDEKQLLADLQANRAEMEQLHASSQTMGGDRITEYEAAQARIKDLALRNKTIHNILNGGTEPAVVKPAEPAVVKPAEPAAKAVAPEKAAATVSNHVSKVVDTKGAKSGADVQYRVIKALTDELPEAEKTSQIKTIEWKPGKAYGGREGSVWVNGEPIANVDKNGYITWGYGAGEDLVGVGPKGQKIVKVDIERFKGDDYTPSQIGSVATAKVAAALNKVRSGGKITIEVPGDGTFTINRDPHSINATIARIQKGGVGPWKNLTEKAVKDFSQEGVPSSSKEFPNGVRKPGKWQNQKGEIPLGLLVKGGSTLAGGTIGAYENPDDPLYGALMGGAAGLAVGAGGAKLAGHLAAGGRTPGAGSTLDEIEKRIPQYVRGGLLSNPFSTLWNAGAGPWGSQTMGGIEQFLKGKVNHDPAQVQMGKDILRSAAPHKWLSKYFKQLPTAVERLNAAEEEELGRAGKSIANPNVIDKVFNLPATYMFMGDLTSVDNLMAAGVPEPLAKKITLTSEVDRSIPRNVANFGKSATDNGNISKWLSLMLPFKRTAANILESGAERTPGLGELVARRGDQTLRKPGKERAVEQGLGTAVFGAAFTAGYNVPDDINQRYKIHSLVSNLGGQYAALAAAGYAAGQARRKGTPAFAAAQNAMTQGIPLPTTAAIQDIMRPVNKAAAGEEINLKDEAMKSMFMPKIIPWIMEQMGQKE